MNRSQVSNLTAESLANSFKPLDRVAMRDAICNVLGECAKKPFSDYASAIVLAAGCVEHHFNLDPKKIGVPLVSQAVAGIQMTQELAGALDFDDADRWMEYNKVQFDAFLDIAKILEGDEEQRTKLWEFVASQAIAVLRGDFDGRQ